MGRRPDSLETGHGGSTTTGSREIAAGVPLFTDEAVLTANLKDERSGFSATLMMAEKEM